MHTTMKGNSIAVLVHFFDLGEQYRENFVFFLSVAYRQDIDFICMIAGHTDLNLPQKGNITYIHTENHGHDFGSFDIALDHGLDLGGYDQIIFINSSVRGPYLAPYYHGSWTYLFTDHLQGRTHLCGASINILRSSSAYHKLYQNKFDHIPPYSHVQTGAYAMTQECFRRLLELGAWEKCRYMDKTEAIVNVELRISQEVKKCGWNMKCFLAPYNWIDYTQPHEDPNTTSKTGHPLSDKEYFGLTLHPYEVVFVKTGWDLISQEAINFYSLTALKQRPSILAEQWSETQSLLKKLRGRAQLVSSSSNQVAVSGLSQQKKSENSNFKQSKACMLVLGMHRSGTSALAGCLKIMGCETPANAMDPHESNKKGFFESHLICQLNNEILALAKSDWSNFLPLNWDWLKSDHGEQLKSRASEILKDEFSNASLIVLKDPRISRLLPFWQQVLDFCGYRTLALVIYRHPDEVAKSLQDRYSFDVDYCRLLWLQYVLESEKDSRKLDRSALSYNQLLNDRHLAIVKIYEDLGFASNFLQARCEPKSSQESIATEIDNFLSTELRHHKIKDNKNDHGSGLEALTIEVYSILQKLSLGILLRPDLVRLDQIKHDLDQGASIFGAMIHADFQAKRLAMTQSNERIT
ncbi:MAG: hypothetical protein NTY67_00910 [Cyanobacteria bacterium]|nr:hypothetical protein [Cyanobacteriota bacterium]